MIRKKPLLTLICGISALSIITAIVIALFVWLPNQKESETYSLSKNENITVNVSGQEVGYFEALDFLGVNAEEITEHYKNVVFVSEETIKMKNVKMFSISGDIELTIKDKTIVSFNFTSNSLPTAENTYHAFDTLNGEIAKGLKSDPNKPHLFVDGKQQTFTDYNDLYSAKNYLETSYKKGQNTITLKTLQLNSAYYVSILYK